MLSQFQADGFVLLDAVLPSESLPSLRREADRLLAESRQGAGARNALASSPPLRELGDRAPIVAVAREVLGARVRPVKLTVFDKSPAANWKVPWHQDLTIAVRERREVAGFGPWTVKDGVPHVQPPAAVLERVVALRVHLDDAGTRNGALRVLPGSHRLGRLSAAAIGEARSRIAERVCPVDAGGAMLMSPLLVHASSASTAPCRRRVLHFEYAAADLPAGLDWA